jgi:hypothetical protein
MVQLRKEKKSKILQSKRRKLFIGEDLTSANDSGKFSLDENSASSSQYRMFPKFTKDPALFIRMLSEIAPCLDEFI